MKKKGQTDAKVNEKMEIVYIQIHVELLFREKSLTPLIAYKLLL